MKLINKLSFVFVVLLGLIPILWFIGKEGILINGVDTNFPLSPDLWFLRRLYVWNPIVNGGVDFSSSTAGLFFHLIQFVFYKFGLELQNVQILSLIFWFTSIIFSSFFLARIILPKKFLFQIIFVCFYSFNIYLFNTWENVKVANMSLVVAIPLALSTLILLKEGKISFQKAGLLSILSGVLVSGAGINPSYFIAFFFVLFLMFIVFLIIDLRIKNFYSRIREFLFISLIIILVNSFWILPTVNYISGNISSEMSIETIGFTNWVDSLSENTSLFNVFRLQGLWDWYAFDQVTGLPLYIPYALNYFHRLPFVLFSLLIPALAIFSFVFRRMDRNYLYLSFGFMLIIGIFLGAGTHQPTGNLFKWLLNNIPFFSLFRSPWYIFTPMIVVAISGLLSLLFYTLDEKFKISKFNLGRVFVWVFATLLIIGNFFYNYPLITGKIFRPTSKDSFFVSFPSYVFEAGNWLKNYDGGRIIGYPDDEIEKFRWGYRGVESILSLVSDSEILFSPLNAPNSEIASLIRLFYELANKGEIKAANSIALKLNVGTVFNKNDQESLSFPLLDELTSLPTEQFGEWDFISYLQEDTAEIKAVTEAYFGYPFRQGVELLEVVPSPSVMLNPLDTRVSQIPNIDSYASKTILAENLQRKDVLDFVTSAYKLSNRLTRRDMTSITFRLSVPESGIYKPIIENYDLESFGLGGQEWSVLLDGKEIIMRVRNTDDSFVYFEDLELTEGEHDLSIGIQSSNLIDENNYVTSVLGDFEIKDEDGEIFWSIQNKDDRDVESTFIVEPFDPFSFYLIRFDYKQIYGNYASVMISQKKKDNTLVKTQVETPPNYPEWNSINFYYQPVKTDSTLSVSLLAPQTKDPLGTKVFYDNLAVYKVFTNKAWFVKEEKSGFSSVEVDFERVSPTLYKGEVVRADSPHILVFSQNYSDDWVLQIKNKNLNKVEPLHFTANYYANAWYVNGVEEHYTFEIYYKPQKFFNTGLIISGITITLVLIFFISKKYLKR